MSDTESGRWVVDKLGWRFCGSTRVPSCPFNETHGMLQFPREYLSLSHKESTLNMGGKDYMTHSMHFMYSGDSKEEKWERFGPTANWSQFGEGGKVEGEGPDWAGLKQPDVIIFGAGYHSTLLSVEEFRDALEEVFKLFDNQAKERLANGLCQPPMYYMNNIMPAPELIPDKYSADVSHRTFINEYWKNRAVFDVAKEYPSIQVIDFMSAELLFNERAHRDAVHLGDESVKKLLLDALLNAIFS